MEHIIDIEPKWLDLCKEVGRGNFNAEILEPACKIADIVRQAQKQGKKEVVFTFVGDTVKVETK